MLEIKLPESEAAAKIIVVGVGGAGNNAVNRMVTDGIVASSSSASIPISRRFSTARHRPRCRSARS